MNNAPEWVTISILPETLGNIHEKIIMEKNGLWMPRYIGMWKICGKLFLTLFFCFCHGDSGGVDS